MFLYGDNLKVLPCIRDESIDLVLTDPQYGIGFMAKVWDKELPHAQAWAECFRVLKPGGFILVMASPRNDDLVSVSLREAGFIKHNSIYWVYGSGFPKGTDVSKAIDKKAIRAWLAERDHGLTVSEVEKVISAAVNGEFFNPRIVAKEQREDWDFGKGSINVNPNRTAGARLIEQLESRFGEMPKRVKVGRRHVSRDLTRNGKTGDMAISDGDVHGADIPITAPATPLAQEFEGMKYGVQHLKPASEVILVFQKPYDGTPLESILKWGVGAVNVDAGRIATGPEGLIKGGCTKIGGLYDMGMKGKEPINKEGHSQGRYPSNFLISHLPPTEHSPGCRVVGERRQKSNSAGTRGGSQDVGIIKQAPRGSFERIGYADADGKETVKEWECIEGCPVAELDRQSGESKSTEDRNPVKSSASAFTGENSVRVSRGDTGGASRFFHQPEWGPADFIYIPKASSAERNAGCEGLKPKRKKVAVIQTKGIKNNGEWEDGKQLSSAFGNPHPTVKPVELFRYLIRLYCGHNPNPVVGDFFAGSGTTEIAGILEGVKTLSIENEWEYCEIAEARAKYWLKNRSTYLTEKRLPKYRPNLPLFEEV